jgi:peroxiredoxin
MPALLMALVFGWLRQNKPAALRPGDQAPDFALPDQNGDVVRLRDFRGSKKVALAFYVRALTPG